MFTLNPSIYLLHITFTHKLNSTKITHSFKMIKFLIWGQNCTSAAFIKNLSILSKYLLAHFLFSVFLFVVDSYKSVLMWFTGVLVTECLLIFRDKILGLQLRATKFLSVMQLSISVLPVFQQWKSKMTLKPFNFGFFSYLRFFHVLTWDNFNLKTSYSR